MYCDIQGEYERAGKQAGRKFFSSLKSVEP
jgi:hypothetical protein